MWLTRSRGRSRSREKSGIACLSGHPRHEPGPTGMAWKVVAAPRPTGRTVDHIGEFTVGLQMKAQVLCGLLRRDPGP